MEPGWPRRLRIGRKHEPVVWMQHGTEPREDERWMVYNVCCVGYMSVVAAISKASPSRDGTTQRTRLLGMVGKSCKLLCGERLDGGDGPVSNTNLLGLMCPMSRSTVKNPPPPLPRCRAQPSVRGGVWGGLRLDQGEIRSYNRSSLTTSSPMQAELRAFGSRK